MKKKILVIDDNSGILFAMQQALQMKDYDVRTAESFAGVASIEKSAPDLIYLDVSLLGQDGREVSRELKGSKGTKNIPIIMLTAHPNADGLAQEAGADSYLPKPFDLTDLWEKTAEYIS
jgi:DNA-binding response OmpR family regulator